MSIRFASLAAISLIASAFNFGDGAGAKDRDAGPEVTRNYQVGAFDKVAVAGPYEVNVVTGGKGGVTARGGQHLLDETEVVVDGDTLEIRPKKKSGMRWSWGGGKAVFTVNAAALRGVAIAGSGGVTVDKVAGDFEGDVAGSGDLRIGQMEGGKATFAIAGSGDIEVAGKADAVELSIAGSGDIRAAGLTARTAEVTIMGSGNVAANASESAEVSMAGSGNVDISGGAKCSVSKAGSGNVNCR